MNELDKYCSVDGCGDLYWAKGLCRFHDSRQRHGIRLDLPRNFKKMFRRGWVHKEYRWVMTDDGREVLEHRHIMEQSLGRNLHVDEIVHHINGNKLDNRIENLEVVDRSDHTSHHRKHAGPCVACGLTDPKGGLGLCHRHRSKVVSFLDRHGVSLPADESAAILLVMGIGIALADANGVVSERINGLKLSTEEIARFANKR